MVGWCLGWLPARAGPSASVCFVRQSHSVCCLCVLVCVSLAATVAAAVATAAGCVWWVGPAFRFPFAPEHLLTQSIKCVTYSYEAIHKNMHIHLPSSLPAPPSLPHLAAPPSCRRTTQVLAGLCWGEDNIPSGRGGGGDGTQPNTPSAIYDDVTSHCACCCVWPALDCLENPFGGGVEKSFDGLVVLGGDFSVCEGREEGGYICMRGWKRQTAVRPTVNGREREGVKKAS